ncbi:hypothetical protein GCM10027073_08740 [Streptomyces chlorus]
MPPLRTLLTIAVSMALLSLAPPVSSALPAPPSDALLPLLVTQGGAPAALPAVEESGPGRAPPAGHDPDSLCADGPAAPPYSGTMSGAPSRAASAVRSSGCRCDSRSASTRFS